MTGTNFKTKHQTRARVLLGITGEYFHLIIFQEGQENSRTWSNKPKTNYIYKRASIIYMSIHRGGHICYERYINRARQYQTNRADALQHTNKI